MMKTKCKKCGKEIEGYNKKHVELLLIQHQMVHRNDKEAKKE